MKSKASGVKDSNNIKRKPFTKEDYILWHEREAPSWKRGLAYYY